MYFSFLNQKCSVKRSYNGSVGHLEFSKTRRLYYKVLFNVLNKSSPVETVYVGRYALLQDSAFTHELLTLLQGQVQLPFIGRTLSFTPVFPAQAHLPFNELQASVNWLLDELDSESSPFIRLATHNACNSTGQPEMFIEYQLPSTMSLLMANTEVLSHSALLLLKLKLSLAHLYNNKSRANFIRHEFAAAFRLQTTLSAVDQDISLHLETARRTVLTIISVSGGCLSSLAGALHGFMSSIQSA
jgi:hypothetical protein